MILTRVSISATQLSRKAYSSFIEYKNYVIVGESSVAPIWGAALVN